jgi:tetratricopeptide (TPR) repeat protein
MQSPNEKPQICWSCEKNEATEPFTHGGHTALVCVTCLPRLKARDQLEHVLRQSMELKELGQVDAALACLDAFLEANRHRDHDKSLARSIARNRAWILFDAGRYAEAEQACEAWAELGFAEVWERWMHGDQTAETLDALGRSREGLAVLEDALSYRDPKYVPGAWSHLATLAEISEKLGQPVDPKWRSLAEESGEWWGVEMPKHESLGKAILELAEAIRKTQPMRRGEGEDSEDDDEP